MRASEIAARKAMLMALLAAHDSTKTANNLAYAELNDAINQGDAALQQTVMDATQVVLAMNEYKKTLLAEIEATDEMVPDRIFVLRPG